MTSAPPSRTRPCASPSSDAATSGSALVGILQDRADALAVQPAPASRSAGIAVHDLAAPAARPRPAGPAHRRRRRPGRRPASTSWSSSSAGSIRPGHWCGRPSSRASRWSRPTRRCWPPPRAWRCARLARAQGVDLLYEAAVAGAIPLVRALRESLTGERIHRVMGIVNGTTNFILTKMSEQGADYADGAGRGPGARAGRARPDRRRRGVRRRGQGGHPGRRGLRLRRGRRRRACARASPSIRPSTSSSPGGSATSVKLLAIVERDRRRRGCRSGSTRPWCPRSHPLAGVRDAFNAVFIEGEAAGELMLYGQGAGGLPDGQRRGRRPDRRRRATCSPAPPPRPPTASRPGCCPSPSCGPAFYMSLDVADRPGCWPRWPRSSATTACPSGRWSRRASATRPGWSS